MYNLKPVESCDESAWSHHLKILHDDLLTPSRVCFQIEPAALQQGEGAGAGPNFMTMRFAPSAAAEVPDPTLTRATAAALKEAARAAKELENEACALQGARPSTDPLLSSTSAVFDTETTQYTQRILQKILKRQNKRWSECKPLAGGAARQDQSRGTADIARHVIGCQSGLNMRVDDVASLGPGRRFRHDIECL